MFLTFLTVIVLVVSQVDHTPIVPLVHTVRMQPKVETVPSKHTFSHSFGSLGYEISGRVYETNIGLLDDQLFQNKFYRTSDSCSFYNSQLSVEPVSDSKFDDELSVQASTVAEEASKAFILVSNDDYLIDHNQSNKVILTFDFSSQGATKSNQNISISDLGLREDQQIDIQLFAKGNLLLVTDGVKIIGMDIKNNQKWAISLDENSGTVKIDYQFARLNDLLLLTIVQQAQQGPQLIILWNQVAKIYRFSADFKTATFVKELKPPSGKQFTSGVFQDSYYLLIQEELVVYRNNSDPVYITLQSQDCWGINKYESTIHVICRESGSSYVAEYYYNSGFEKVEQALKLNRYYTEIDDVRVISRFGSQLNPKLLMSGDYDLMLTAYGINRQVLIDSNQRQTTNRYKSLGLEKIITVKSLTTNNSTYAIGVGTKFVYFFRINEKPAEIECNLERKQSMIRWNILVEVNTTSCPRNSQIEQLQSICQYNIPFTFYVSLFEVDSEKQTTVHIFASVVLLACALLILGCAFHCKAVRTRAINQIQKKLEALKNRKKPKPI